jgi:hypothetical protein
MFKNVAAAIAACLYVALSAWLVGSVGKAHRSSLSQARSAQPTASSSSDRVAVTESVHPSQPEAPAPPRLPDSMEKPAARATTTAPSPTSHPALAKAMTPSPTSHPEPAEPTKRATASAEPAAKPAEKELAPTAPVKPELTKAAAPRLEDIDPFFGLPQAKKRWDLSRLTTDQEKELGRELNEMVLLPRFNRKLTQGTLVSRVIDAAEPLLEARSRKEIEYQFVILDSEAINAFSHPGGYVYVTRGLLDWISEDENYALQFALAHEIYHVDRGHALRCLQDPGVRNLPFGTLPLFYLLIFPRGYYPDQMEFEADAWALLQLQRLGCTPRESLKFIQKMVRYAEDQDFVEGRAKPLSGQVASLFDNHYRAHPAARNRLKKLRALVEQPAGKPR